MRRWAEILRGTKGETLVEIIVSMVIVAIAFTAFGTCAVMAGRVNHRVSVQDQKMYELSLIHILRAGEASITLHRRGRASHSPRRPGYLCAITDLWAAMREMDIP